MPRASACWFLIAAVTACASDKTDTPSGAAGTPGVGGSAGAAGSAGSAGKASDGGEAGARPTCPAGPGYPGSVRKLLIEKVSATIVDSSGAPAPDIMAQLCGIDVCIKGKTDLAGRVTIATTTPIDRPAFKYGVGLRYAQFALALPDQATVDLGTVITPKLPDFEQGVPMQPGSEASSGGVTLGFAANAQIDIDTLTYAAGQEGFRAAQIPTDRMPTAVDASLGLELVFALAPVDTRVCPAASMRVANSLGWAPGSAIEFFAHGVDIEQEWSPYAGWAVVSPGTVTADGAYLETAPGSGIPIVTVIGIRKKP